MERLSPLGKREERNDFSSRLNLLLTVASLQVELKPAMDITADVLRFEVVSQSSLYAFFSVYGPS